MLLLYSAYFILYGLTWRCLSDIPLRDTALSSPPSPRCAGARYIRHLTLPTHIHAPVGFGVRIYPAHSLGYVALAHLVMASSSEVHMQSDGRSHPFFSRCLFPLVGSGLFGSPVLLGFLVWP